MFWWVVWFGITTVLTLYAVIRTLVNILLIGLPEALGWGVIATLLIWTEVSIWPHVFH